MTPKEIKYLNETFCDGKLEVEYPDSIDYTISKIYRMRSKSLSKKVEPAFKLPYITIEIANKIRFAYLERTFSTPIIDKQKIYIYSARDNTKVIATLLMNTNKLRTKKLEGI